MPDSRLTRRAALAAMATGAVVLVTDTRAFEDTRSNRAASVHVATDAQAYLGLSGTDAANPAAFENLLTDVDMDIELSSVDAVEFDVDETGGYLPPPVSFTVAAGDTRLVALSGTDSEASVDVHVQLTRNGASAGTIELMRTYQIPQSAAILDVEGSVKQAGQSGKYEFSLTNTQPVGGQTAYLDGISVDATDVPAAAQVGGEAADDVLWFTDAGESIVTGVIDVGGAIAEFSRPGPTDVVELPPPQELTFEFDRFREATADFGSWVGVTIVDVKLPGEDGSTAAIELRA